MKRILQVIILGLVLVSCAEQKYMEIPTPQTSPLATSPSAVATSIITEVNSPTPAPSMAGALSDSEVEEIIGRAAQTTLDDDDLPYLEQIVQDLQPILDAVEEVTNIMTTADLENEEWVEKATEHATALEDACEAAMNQDYGDHLDDLGKLLNAGYSSFQKGASSLRQAVNDNDMDMMSTATGWLMLGINYETKAAEYLQALSSNTSPKPSGTMQPDQSAAR